MQKKFINCQRGAAAVEFAIVLPLLLVFIFGIIEFGCLLYNKAVITNASREGARYSILYETDLDTQLPIWKQKPDVETFVRDRIKNPDGTYRLINFGSSVPSVDVTDPAAGPTPESISRTVTVSYIHHFLVLPDFLSAFFNGGNFGPLTVNSQTTMRTEYQI